MQREAGLDPTAPVRDRLAPRQPVEGSGEGITALAEGTEYHAYERDGLRHGWTVVPDTDGRHHALTLLLLEDGTTWEVTAAAAFETEEEARGWAERLYRETEG